MKKMVGTSGNGVLKVPRGIPRLLPVDFFTFYRPKSDVENIVEDNDKDDDIDEFDEDDDDQSYEGKEVFNRQCFACENERN